LFTNTSVWNAEATNIIIIIIITPTYTKRILKVQIHKVDNKQPAVIVNVTRYIST